MKKLESIVVCDDCVPYLANGDLSGLDYHYGEAEAEERQNEIVTGEAELIAFAKQDYNVIQVLLAVTDDVYEFMRRPCGCCGTRLAGQRTTVNIMGK